MRLISEYQAFLLASAVATWLFVGCGSQPDVEVPENPTPSPGAPQPVETDDPDTENLINRSVSDPETAVE